MPGAFFFAAIESMPPKPQVIPSDVVLTLVESVGRREDARLIATTAKYTRLFSGRAARSIRNRLVRELAAHV